MSSNSLARLSVELSANTAAFQGDMGKAARIAEKEMNSIKDAAGKMGMVLGGALVAAGAAFAAMAKQSIDAADEMNDMSQKIGMSTEKLSALSYAAKMSGADTEILTSGMKKLSSNVVDAARGQGAAKDAFAALGISVRNANGQIKDQDTILREVADKFAGFEDGATKTAMAVDIFGKAGADLIPMLDGGAAGLDAMAAEASSMGVVLSSETAAAAGQVNDNIDQMKLMMGGAVNQVTAGMLPAFSSLTEIMKRGAQDTGFMTTVAEGLSVAFKALATVAMGTQAVFQLVGDTIGKVAAAAMAAISGDFAGAKAIMADTSASDRLSDSLSNIRDLWKGVGVEAKSAASAQSGAMGAAPAYSQKAGAKGKKPKAGKTGEDWDSALGMSIDQWAAEEDQKNATILAKRREGTAQQLQQLQQSLLSKRMLEDMDFNQKKLQLEDAARQEIINETQKQALLEDLERQHKAKVKAMDDEELARKRAATQQAIGFFNNGLSAIANSQSKYAKQAQAIQKAQALYKVGVDTRSAAMGAYAAMVGIPIIGPALAVVAAGAAIAFGAAQASAIGGGISGGGGTAAAIPSTPATNVNSNYASAVEPSAAQQSKLPSQTTTIKFEADQIVLGRQLVDLMNEVAGDGKTIQNLRFALS